MWVRMCSWGREAVGLAVGMEECGGEGEPVYLSNVSVVGEGAGCWVGIGEK